MSQYFDFLLKRSGKLCGSEKFLAKIRRQGVIPVCVTHFDEKYLGQNNVVVNQEGVRTLVQRNRLSLTGDAVPTIFEGENLHVPNYLSTVSAPRRTDPTKRRRAALDREEEARKKNENDAATKDMIQDFEDFVKSFQKST